MKRAFPVIWFVLIYGAGGTGSFPVYGQSQRLALDESPSFEEDDVALLLDYLLTASEKEQATFAKTLRPTLEDCETIFSDGLAHKVFKYQKHLRRQQRVVPRPLSDRQTEFVYWSANAEELGAYEAGGQYFPGGYRELAQFLNPELTYIRFKFVEPGHKMGSAYDMLVYVNGHWVLILRPWVVLF